MVGVRKKLFNERGEALELVAQKLWMPHPVSVRGQIENPGLVEGANHGKRLEPYCL